MYDFEWPWGWIVFFIALNGAISAFVSYSLAEQKGHPEPSTYGVFGFLFGLFGLIYAAAIPDLKTRAILTEIENRMKAASSQDPSSQHNESTAPTQARFDYSDLPPLQ